MPSPLTEAQVIQQNHQFLDEITSRDPLQIKHAVDSSNDFTRTKMREDGFWRRILPPTPLTPDAIDRSPDTDKPVKYVDLEPDSPGAITVPYATTPMRRYINAPRYTITFARVMTRRFFKDVAELYTYNMDIRQVIMDNSLKDMLAEEDGKGISAVNNIIGAAGSTVPETGGIQYVALTGGLTRANMKEALKILPGLRGRFETDSVLINNLTIKDYLGYTRDSAGGDVSQEWLLNGFTQKEIMGKRHIITIKKDLVPNGTIYLFAEPKALGRFYTLEDATLYVDTKAFMLEWFAYGHYGSGIGNYTGCARVDLGA